MLWWIAPNPKTKPGGAGPLGWLDSGDSPFFQSINFHNLTAGFIQPRHANCGVCAGPFRRSWVRIPLHTYTFAMCMLWLMRYFSNENTQSRLHISDQCKTWGKMHAPGWGSNSRPSDFSLVILDYETDALPTAQPRPPACSGTMTWPMPGRWRDPARHIMVNGILLCYRLFAHHSFGINESVPQSNT